MLLSRFVAGMLPVSLMVLGAGMVEAQPYPNKPIRIVAATAGSGDDFTARIVAQGIAGPLGQPVIVDNRGAGFIAAEVVSKAPPDGYSLTIQGGAFWNTPLLRRMPYDPVSDFSPISLISREVFVLAVHPSVPVKSVKELIDLAKAKPGELNYSSGATGASAHLASELFKSLASVNITRVAYKGGAAAVTALIGGEVQMTIFDASLIMPHVKSGKLRALAVTTAQPTALVPGVPTVTASGLPGYEAAGLVGIFAPAKTPGTIINRLNREIVRLINLPDIKEKFSNAGVEVVGSSPEQFSAIIKSDISKMDKVIKEAGIKVD